MRCGFSGGLVVDYPESTKAKKYGSYLFVVVILQFVCSTPLRASVVRYYLVLFAGTTGDRVQMPAAKSGWMGGVAADAGSDSDEQATVAYGGSRETHNPDSKRKKRDPVKSRNWVLKKKERQRKQGMEVRPDTKYTGRSRGPKF